MFRNIVLNIMIFGHNDKKIIFLINFPTIVYHNTTDTEILRGNCSYLFEIYRNNIIGIFLMMNETGNFFLTIYFYYYSHHYFCVYCIVIYFF